MGYLDVKMFLLTTQTLFVKSGCGPGRMLARALRVIDRPFWWILQSIMGS